MNTAHIQTEHAELRHTMQERRTNTLSGVLYSLHAHERLTVREFEAYTRGLSVPGLRGSTYDELVARFGIRYDADRSLFVFFVPTVNLNTSAQ